MRGLTLKILGAVLVVALLGAGAGYVFARDENWWPAVLGGPTQWEKDGEELYAALKDYSAQAPDFAVAVTDNETGETFDYYGDQKFETASVVKVDILAATLLKAQDEGRELDAREKELAGKMIRVSDNDSATSLFNDVGGASGLAAANAKMSLSATEPQKAWGLTKTTARDQVTLVSGLLREGGPFESYARGTAQELMTSVDAEQDWGVTAASKEGETTALKNGWLSRSTEGGAFIINSVGRVTGDDVDISIAVLSHGNKTMESGISTVEDVTRMTRQHLAW
jgi:beta-lactamase class A